jgi:hypothetical protein
MHGGESEIASSRAQAKAISTSRILRAIGEEGRASGRMQPQTRKVWRKKRQKNMKMILTSFHDKSKAGFKFRGQKN